jgi:AcrR family transcriptional regulator
MSPRNSARTEKIVEAAAHLFARQGYHGTSTRQIAHLAKVSENTLFRHFDHKEDLFWSALRSRVAGLTFQWDLLKGIGDGDVPEVVLPKIVELLLNSVNSRPEVLRLIAVASLELQGKAESVWRDLLSPFFSRISKYLAACVEKGEVLEVNPTLLTASLMAMAFMHPQLSRLTDDNSLSKADNQDAVRAYSKFWIDVLSARLPVSSSPNAQTVVQAST